MSRPHSDLPPLLPDVMRLIEAEKQGSGPSMEEQARIFGRLSATLGFPDGPDGPDGGDSNGSSGGDGPTGTEEPNSQAHSGGDSATNKASPASAHSPTGEGAQPVSHPEGFGELSSSSGGTFPPNDLAKYPAPVSQAPLGGGSPFSSLSSTGIGMSMAESARSLGFWAKGAEALAALFKPAVLIPFAVGTIAGAGSLAIWQSFSDTREHHIPQAVERVPRKPPISPHPSSVEGKGGRPSAPTGRVSSPPSSIEEKVVRSGANSGSKEVRADERPQTSNAASLDAQSKISHPQRPRLHGKTLTHPELSEERHWIEMARMALARGSLQDAFTALKEHRKHFPHGQFLEERDGLYILTLLSAHRNKEAKRHAEQFFRRYPQSLLRPAIEAAFHSKPE